MNVNSRVIVFSGPKLCSGRNLRWIPLPSSCSIWQARNDMADKPSREEVTCLPEIGPRCVTARARRRFP